MVCCDVIPFSSPSNLTKQIFLIHFGRGRPDPEKPSSFPEVTELVNEEAGPGPSPTAPHCSGFYRCVEPLPNSPEKDLGGQSQHSFLKKRKCFGIFLGEKRVSEEERRDVIPKFTGAHLRSRLPTVALRTSLHSPFVLRSHTALSPEDPSSPHVHTRHFP